MDVYEITGNTTGLSKAGVNYLQPGDSYQSLVDGYIYRQQLVSRKGFAQFAPQLANGTRVLGIFEFLHTDNTTELLVADTNNLYTYNTGTGAFDLIPFAGSMAAYPGFDITAKDGYISGVSYPTDDNASRFVFTGSKIALNGTSALFFYDGSNIYDFTDAGDNPDYAAPPEGAINRATFLLYFNERLNLIAPTIAAAFYPQGQLYSGIRDTAGNGDKFNVPGSGLLQLPTADFITGASILGQYEVINMRRSDWVFEITPDAFNPYKFRQVPGVIGSDANFSPVAWYDSVKSLGKTGGVSTDARRSDRFDNKVPYFTAQEIDQKTFNYTYGGFDRINGQFLWAYVQSGSGATTQNGVLVYNYEENTWATFNQRFSCFGQIDIGIDLVWNDIDETIDPSWISMDQTTDIWDEIGIEDATQKTLAGDDLGFIYEINKDYDDYTVPISGVSNAYPTVLNVPTSGLQINDRITISGVLGVTGPEPDDTINNFDPEGENLDYVPYTIIGISSTTVTINYDSTLSSAYISGGTISKVISFSAETIPFNPYRNIGRKCYVSHVEILIDNNQGSLKLSIFNDEDEFPFKANVICQPDNTLSAAREWISVSVNQESNFLSFQLKQERPDAQLIVTSMRIHCEPGALTTG